MASKDENSKPGIEWPRLDDSIPVRQMAVGSAFESLTEKEKRYAHHLASAAWQGSRIILEQVSPEANDIFDFVIEVYASCHGDWELLEQELSLEKAQIDGFVRYAATFLSNLGNFYGRGDQKFVPRVEYQTLEKLASISKPATDLWDKICYSISSVLPHTLGYPSDTTQSQYYPTVSSRLSAQDITEVSNALQRVGIWPENTRLRKENPEESHLITVLQASTEIDARMVETNDNNSSRVHLRRGDHHKALTKICSHLNQALEFTSNEAQKSILSKYIESFTTGDLEAYRNSQKLWVQDKYPRVENIFGFVEQYRDPAGIRSEFQALVAIDNQEESKVLMKLVEQSDGFIRKLPWARGSTTNNGKGPFEKIKFEPPSFASIHSLAYCATSLFDGINLPNYDDIRQDHGFKNVVIANRLAAGRSTGTSTPYLEEAEAAEYGRYEVHISYIWLVLHELLGHGTGRMMIEESDSNFNFAIDNPPINPLSSSPVESWYKPGETWTSKFGDIATSAEECRAELVGACLTDNKELLGILGIDEQSELNPDDLTYYLYLHIGVCGLDALSNFNVDIKKWGQAHDRARFAILRCLLANGNGCMTITHDVEKARLVVNVDRQRITSGGRPALDMMLLKLHMYRMTADVGACRPYYEALSTVEDEHLEWRKTVLSKPSPRLNYVHANTFLEDGKVRLKEYEANNDGILQSWYDRKV